MGARAKRCEFYTEEIKRRIPFIRFAAAQSLNTCGVHWFCSSNMCSPKEHGAGSSSIYSRRQINSYRFSHNSFMVYMDTCNKLTIHILKARCCNTYLMFLLKWMYSCTTRQYCRGLEGQGEEMCDSNWPIANTYTSRTHTSNWSG